jgi:hypothetical protein
VPIDTTAARRCDKPVNLGPVLCAQVDEFRKRLRFDRKGHAFRALVLAGLQAVLTDGEDHAD